MKIIKEVNSLVTSMNPGSSSGMQEEFDRLLATINTQKGVVSHITMTPIDSRYIIIATILYNRFPIYDDDGNRTSEYATEHEYEQQESTSLGE